MDKLEFEVNENGITIHYNIIKYIHNHYTNKDYIVYEEENDNRLYASAFTLENDDLKLEEIETEAEWDYIDAVLGGLQNE